MRCASVVDEKSTVNMIEATKEGQKGHDLFGSSGERHLIMLAMLYG